MHYFLLGLLLISQTLLALTVSPEAVAGDAGGIVGSSLRVGAERPELYLASLKGKRLALVVNQTSRVGSQHLVDYLQEANMDIRRIFAPEHGFRGTADAGATVADGIDPRSGVPVQSLYGKQKKPEAEQLSDVDVILFDIQDVGVRYYTYISTMHYVMEAAAEQGKTLFILDRPNPNGDYVDGPILEQEHRSFVGMHPIPLVHGLTVGELARMIKGEGWIAAAESLDLKIIPVAQYNHITRYTPPIPPSVCTLLWVCLRAPWSPLPGAPPFLFKPSVYRCLRPETLPSRQKPCQGHSFPLIAACCATAWTYAKAARPPISTWTICGTFIRLTLRGTLKIPAASSTTFSRASRVQLNYSKALWQAKVTPKFARDGKRPLPTIASCASSICSTDEKFKLSRVKPAHSSGFDHGHHALGAALHGSSRSSFLAPQRPGTSTGSAARHLHD